MKRAMSKSFSHTSMITKGEFHLANEIKIINR